MNGSRNICRNGRDRPTRAAVRLALVALCLLATGAAGLAAPMTAAERRVADAALGISGSGVADNARSTLGHALEGNGPTSNHLGIEWGNVLLPTVDSTRGVWRGSSVTLPSGRSESASIGFFRFDSAADRSRFLTCVKSQDKDQSEGMLGRTEHDFTCSGSGESLVVSGYSFTSIAVAVGSGPPTRHYSCAMYRAVGPRFAVGFSITRPCEQLAGAGGLLSAMQAAAQREAQRQAAALDRSWADVVFTLTERDRAATEALNLARKPALRLKALERLPQLRPIQMRALAEIGYEHDVFARLAALAPGSLRMFENRTFGVPSEIDLIVLERAGAAEGLAAAANNSAEGTRECYRAMGARYVVRFRIWHGMDCAAQQGAPVRHLFDTLEAALLAAIGPLPDETASPPRAPPSGPVRESGRPGSAPVPPPADTPVTAPPPPGPAGDTETGETAPPGETTEAGGTADLTPAEIAAISGLTGGVALLGALSMLGASGVRRQEILDEIRGLLRGRSSPDPFEAWKAKYQALGWTYSERNGVATFDPVDGARNEAGEIYSRARGGFVPPDGAASPPSAPPMDGTPNARGEVWSENDRAFVQREYWQQERARLRDLETRRAGEIAEAERVSRTEADAFAVENARLAREIADSQAQRAAVRAAEQSARERLAGRLRATGSDPAAVDRLLAAGDTFGLKQLYADHLRRVMDAATAEAARQKQWADVMAAGAYVSKATLSAAKAGMVVVGGPAGTLAVATGLGAIGSVEEGARAIVAGAGAKEVAGAFATGFLSGAKDGAIGRYVNMPGISAATKVALPAAADAAEAYARTGDLRVAITAGTLSAVGGAAGQAVGGINPGLAREGAQLLLGGTMGAAGRATTDGAVAEGFLDGLAGGVGSSVGGRAAHLGVARAEPLPLPGADKGRLVQTDPKLTAADVQLDADATVRKTQARGLVEDLRRAVAQGTPDEQKAALTRVLENRDAKLLMKGAEVDPATKSAFADLTEQHRTKPVFTATADHLNRQTAGDGTPRFVVREPDPANPGGFLERRVLPTDFRSTSGSTGKAPGMDLDMTATPTIVDRSTGRPARPADLDAAVSGACKTLGISKTGQEINVMHGESLERYTLRPGEDPSKFIPRVASGDVSGAEGRSLTEVTRAKLGEADVLHTGASAVSEKCRIAAKDFDRITQPLMDSKAGARLPPVFAVRDAATGETPLDIMRAVADNRMLPGTGNAKFRALTGMDLSEGADTLAQLPEFVAKFGATGRGGATPGGFDPTLSSGDLGREAARAALRDALRLGGERN